MSRYKNIKFVLISPEALKLPEYVKEDILDKNNIQYVETNDMNGLTKYYKQLLTDCNQVNNLSSLSPDEINNPAVYTVLANKYYRADELNIKITLDKLHYLNFQADSITYQY